MASAVQARYAVAVLRRLLLLLALLLALPATARPACHDADAARVTQVSMHHAGGHGEHRAAPEIAHECVGCIPPDMLLGVRVSGAMAPRALVIRVGHVPFAPGATNAPTPPPPKSV
jgi:hypothetical protein